MDMPDPGAPSGDYIKAALKAAREGTGRLRKAANYTLAAAAAYELGKQIHHRLKTEYTHTISLVQDDEIYDTVQEWLLSMIPANKRRSLSARSYRGEIKGSGHTRGRRSYRDLVEAATYGGDNERREGKLVLFYDGQKQQTVQIGSHRIKVNIKREEKKMGTYSREVEQIIFTARDAAGRDAVANFLQDLSHKKHEQGHSRLFIADRYNDWSIVDIPPRELDTVILREGQIEELVADLGRFLDSEEDYVDLGIPWHRGYLFYGPPGTGKTSLAKALAEHFQMDIYYIPLSDVQKDMELLTTLNSVRPRSILILEDVDVVHASKSRDDAESQGISLSGLLNALDGMVTPHGLVTIMTTNDRDSLDSALRRPGRSDREEELGFLDDEQLHRLVRKMIGDAPGKLPKVPPQMTHADIVESVKRVIGDPEEMLAAVKARLKGK